MLRKPFHGWRVKQEIQKLTAIRTPSPRQSPGSPTHPTPLPLSFSTARTFHPRLTFVFPSKPPHFLSLQARWATYYSRAPNPKLEVSPACEFHVEDKEAMKYGGKVIEGDRPEQLASKLELSPGREFRVADGEEHDYRPKETICLVRMSLWERTKLEASTLVYEVTSQDEVDRFYQEMSKEVETLLHERDQ
ncbi:uncharacterized protein LOC130139187 [Syzygium oleosum]|uniref:uncharacterized protein LOC130139187 n=1 Tax=Syzygium oleosum TaxID=219896 RepID=UPI0024BA8498|nr:uncharacterized protein LOC130139187 [Syzygium oleosum]